MTTTTETTTTTRTCPPSDVADMIVPWPEVQPGEVVLWDGEFRRVERIYPMDYGNPAFVLDGDTHNGTIPVGTHAAVRRYTEGAPEADPPLSETGRWQVEEARSTLGRWDRKHGPEIYGTDRTLADTIRGLLVIVDELAPAGEES